MASGPTTPLSDLFRGYEDVRWEELPEVANLDNYTDPVAYVGPRDSFVREEFVTELGVDENTALRLTLASLACGAPFIGAPRPRPPAPSFLDAGYVFAPYVPLVMSKVSTPQPLDDPPVRKGMRSRYAAGALRSRFYTTLELDGQLARKG